MAPSRHQRSKRSSTPMKFSGDRKQYVLTDGDGGVGGTVHAAKHVNPESGDEVPVEIKVFDIYRMEDIFSLTSDVHRAKTFDHENIVKAHCSFMADDRLWVVMPPLGIPIRSIIRSYFPQGMPEDAVAFILKETLKGLHYMHEKKEVQSLYCINIHDKNVVHGNIGAGCVFLDDKCRVKIGISSITQENININAILEHPEFVADYGESRLDKATDILMFGFLALELLYGEIPRYEELRSLIANGFGETKVIRVLSCFRAERKRVPTPLAEVMAACLCRDPKARPTTNDLLIKFSLFRNKFFGNRSSAGKLILKKLMVMNKLR